MRTIIIIIKFLAAVAAVIVLALAAIPEAQKQCEARGGRLVALEPTHKIGECVGARP